MKHIVIDARNRLSSTGRYTDRLLHHLQNLPSEHKYSILVQPNDTWKPVNNNFTRIDCSFKQFSLNPFDQIYFAKQLNNLKPSIVHFTMPQQPILFFGKRVTTLHDLTFLRYPRKKESNSVIFFVKMILYKFLLKVATLTSSKIIVPSNYVKDDLYAYSSRLKNKISVIYEATEPTAKDGASKIEIVNNPFLLHVGSPFPHKNINRLLEAFSILKHNHADLQLVLVGKKEFYFHKLQKNINKLPDTNDIITTGFVTDSELKWLYENAACYVLPSLSEGFGLPGLEAMANGSPVVSSNATCLPEIYGDAALFFNPNNVDDMALKIDRVLRDKTFKHELIKRGYAQVKKYSWEKMAAETLAVYQKVLE